MRFSAASVEHRQRLRRIIGSIDDHVVGRAFSFNIPWEDGRHLTVLSSYAAAAEDLLKYVDILLGQRDHLQDQLEQMTRHERDRWRPK